ncbi:hypothetical protein KEM54_000028 [Ascosphaera aggregata]|nr:hypothetical protein KEM54_000028 [Ascosphaera aggregata]
MTEVFAYDTIDCRNRYGQLSDTYEENLASSITCINQQPIHRLNHAASFASSNSSAASSVFSSHCPLSSQTTLTRLSDSESSFRNGISCAADEELKEHRRKMNEEFQRHYLRLSQIQQSRQQQHSVSAAGYSRASSAGQMQPYLQVRRNTICTRVSPTWKPCPAASKSRQNPRRSCSTYSNASASKHLHESSHQQREKGFVERLVDSATQIVEVIWPVAAYASLGEPSQASREKLSLHTFIQEVLRRSKSSYSTLQVALYYLILIKSHVPNRAQIAEAQRTHDEYILSKRVMMCGRRMFLTALILASKYLQDHNYSARAWAKISGLDVHELNANELTFLKAVNWKLHIPETLFQKWNEVVVRLTSEKSASTATQEDITWRTIVPHLTPELDTMEYLFRPQFTASSLNAVAVLNTKDSKSRSLSTPASSPLGDFVTAQPIPRHGAKVRPTSPISGHVCPRHAAAIPIAQPIEPNPRLDHASHPPPPPLPPLTSCLPLASKFGCCLPTPRTTPSIATMTTSTPASNLPQPSAMSIALEQANQLSFIRTTLDRQASSLPSRSSSAHCLPTGYVTQPNPSYLLNTAGKYHAAATVRRPSVPVGHSTGLSQFFPMTTSPEPFISPQSARYCGSYERIMPIPAAPSSSSSLWCHATNQGNNIPMSALAKRGCASAVANQNQDPCKKRSCSTVSSIAESRVDAGYSSPGQPSASRTSHLGAVNGVDFSTQEAAQGLCYLSCAVARAMSVAEEPLQGTHASLLGSQSRKRHLSYSADSDCTIFPPASKIRRQNDPTQLSTPPFLPLTGCSGRFSGQGNPHTSYRMCDSNA